VDVFGRFSRLLVLGGWLCSCAAADLIVGEKIGNQPFRRYFTHDRFDRRVSFYLSEPEPTEEPLPLIVFVQGTGCSSHFTGREGRVLKGIPNLLHDVVGARARVLAVDKAGVEFLDDQRGRPMQEACSSRFFQEHTLDRWTEAIASSIRSARTLPSVDGSRTLVAGISEGAMVAVRVSNILPGVTHAASLSGGGPNHLHVLAEYVRRRGLDPEELVFGCWSKVQRDPDSTTNFCLDHPYRHWSSFYRTSLIEECLRAKAKLRIVHGSADEQNGVSGFDVLQAELAAHGVSAALERLEGADHGLNLPAQQPPEGLLAVFGRMVDWFFEEQ
jgi:pimeloyl-ACP methyl ester carboxylesterase